MSVIADFKIRNSIRETHRSAFPGVIDQSSRRQAIVVSDDVELRRTVTGILNALNCECAALPMLIAEVRLHLDTYAGGVSLTLIDLDGPRDDIDACLEMLHTVFRIKQVTGMSVFAAALENEAKTNASQYTSFAVSRLIEKTELLPQLQEYLGFTSLRF